MGTTRRHVGCGPKSFQKNQEIKACEDRIKELGQTNDRQRRGRLLYVLGAVPTSKKSNALVYRVSSHSKTTSSSSSSKDQKDFQIGNLL